jgi:hypothetical protein
MARLPGTPDRRHRPAGQAHPPPSAAGAGRRRRRVAEIQQYWSQIVGPERFAATCLTLQDLLDTLTSSNNGT